MFSNLVFGFQFLTQEITAFLPNEFYGFSGFNKEITLCSHALKQ